jgi:hypothetical protein
LSLLLSRGLVDIAITDRLLRLPICFGISDAEVEPMIDAASQIYARRNTGIA